MDAKKAFTDALNHADFDLLIMSEMVGNLEFWRDGVDNWGDVGTMRHISEQLTEIRHTLEQYCKTRLPEED